MNKHSNNKWSSQHTIHVYEHPLHKIHVVVYSAAPYNRIIRTLFVETLNIEGCSDFIFRHIFKQLADE